MKTIIIIILTFLVGLGLGYVVFGGKYTAKVTDTGSPVKQLYTCGMHPEIISEEPGYCPICGMKLVPKRERAEPSGVGVISIDPVMVQNMNMRTSPVLVGRLSKTIRAYGQIDYDETRQYAVNMKISGWIEKLYVDFEGAEVKAGDKLLDIYSPELVAAQKEYLVAYENNKNATAIHAVSQQSRRLVEASERRLVNWDISQDQIQRLRTTGEVSKTVAIRAPASGVVVKKYAVQGTYLKAGANLFEVVDLSNVWLKAFVYEQELPYLRLGQNVVVKLPYVPGEIFSGRISFISPELINSGVRQLVFVEVGDGKFEPREVHVGHYGDNDMLEIVSGLEKDEKIVTSGQFLLDSETRLNEALSRGHAHGSDELITKPSAQQEPQETIQHHVMNKGKQEKETEEKTWSGIYTCPMDEHSHILEYGPGNCPICGMKLTPVEKTSGRTIYVCPMPEDSMVSFKPGKCPKCGMKLVKMEKKPEITLYVCPMPEDSVVSFKPGECPKCGMKLVPADKLKEMTVYVCPMAEDSVVSFNPGKCPKCGMKLEPIKIGGKE